MFPLFDFNIASLVPNEDLEELFDQLNKKEVIKLMPLH
jgi:hypothetical protein